MDTIVAIIPTFNRREMLRDCLNALAAQTRPLNLMIVVDNGSADGTRQMISNEFPEVQYVFIEKPCGSAGGFAEGFKIAMAQGYEWVWLMDNDAYPAPDGLERLLNAAQSSTSKVFNSLVIAPDGETINWGYHLYSGATYRDGVRTIKTVSEILSLGKPILNGLAQFYPGALLHRDVVSRVGVPTPGFFTRGDEVDYALRIQRAGFITLTVVASRVTHPLEPRIHIKFMGQELDYPWMSPMKQYYALRNAVINGRKYNFNGDASIRSYCRLFLSYCRMSLALPDRQGLRLIYTAMAFADGIAGRLYVNNFVR